MELEGGVAVRMTTDYPWNGRVEIEVEKCAEPFGLNIRKPGWCASWTLSVNGEPRTLQADDGYLRLSVRPGDRLTLDMDMAVRRVYADPRVAEDRGRVAVMRGPVVFCAEEVDNPGIPTEYFHADAALSREAVLTERFREDLFGGVPTIEADGLTLIPYCLWDNREPSGMAVWLREV